VMMTPNARQSCLVEPAVTGRSGRAYFDASRTRFPSSPYSIALRASRQKFHANDTQSRALIAIGLLPLAAAAAAADPQVCCSGRTRAGIGGQDRR